MNITFMMKSKSKKQKQFACTTAKNPSTKTGTTVAWFLTATKTQKNGGVMTYLLTGPQIAKRLWVK